MVPLILISGHIKDHQISPLQCTNIKRCCSAIFFVQIYAVRAHFESTRTSPVSSKTCTKQATTFKCQELLPKEADSKLYVQVVLCRRQRMATLSDGTTPPPRSTGDSRIHPCKLLNSIPFFIRDDHDCLHLMTQQCYWRWHDDDECDGDCWIYRYYLSVGPDVDFVGNGAAAEARVLGERGGVPGLLSPLEPLLGAGSGVG